MLLRNTEAKIVQLIISVPYVAAQSIRQHYMLICLRFPSPFRSRQPRAVTQCLSRRSMVGGGGGGGSPVSFPSVLLRDGERTSLQNQQVNSKCTQICGGSFFWKIMC